MKNHKSFKTLSIVMALVVMLFSLAGCGQDASQTTKAATVQSETTKAPETTAKATEATTVAETTTEAADPNEGKFVIEYPSDMQAKGFTEPLVLEKAPEKVACLTAAPVPALHELGVNLVGIPSSRVIQWPEDLLAKTTLVAFNAHSPEDFDFESLIVLEPDLVILSSGAADTAGKKLVEEFQLPVYYIMGGHTVKYESVKLQTEELVKSFAKGDLKATGEAMLKRFEDLEQRLVKAKEAFAGKKVMVLQSGGDKHFIQTDGGTLGSMLQMLGFENVFTNEGSSMVQLDLEQALSYEPDYVVCVGGGTPEQHKEVMEKVFAENTDYWHSIEAIKDGRVLYLGIDYVANTGTHVVRHIANLVDYMSELTGIKVE